MVTTIFSHDFNQDWPLQLLSVHPFIHPYQCALVNADLGLLPHETRLFRAPFMGENSKLQIDAMLVYARFFCYIFVH